MAAAFGMRVVRMRPFNHAGPGQSDDYVVGTLTRQVAEAEAAGREEALVRTETGRWRLYVCCATPESKHWWIDVLEADDPAGLADAEARTVFPGDDRTAVKDPVVRHRDGRWHAWVCCHPLDLPGEEDRMTTAYATSADGLAWDWHGTVLAGRAVIGELRAAAPDKELRISVDDPRDRDEA